MYSKLEFEISPPNHSLYTPVGHWLIGHKAIEDGAQLLPLALHATGPVPLLPSISAPIIPSYQATAWPDWPPHFGLPTPNWQTSSSLTCKIGENPRSSHHPPPWVHHHRRRLLSPDSQTNSPNTWPELPGPSCSRGHRQSSRHNRMDSCGPCMAQPPPCLQQPLVHIPEPGLTPTPSIQKGGTTSPTYP